MIRRKKQKEEGINISSNHLDTKTFETIIIDREDRLGFKRAVEAIQAGELVAFPTETVYGLGANALDAMAVEKIFEAKGRPGDNPLIVHVHSLDQMRTFIREITPLAQILIDAFMPGPITLILHKKDSIPDTVSANLSTVGVRIPQHPVALAFLKAVKVPLAAPSANISGGPSPTKSQHVWADLYGRIPYILEGGSCEVGLESTVVDVTGEKPVILRPGAVTEEMITWAYRCAFGLEDQPKDLFSKGMEGENFLASPKAPGMKYMHYAPKALVIPLNTFQFSQMQTEIFSFSGKRIGLFLSEKEWKDLRNQAEKGWFKEPQTLVPYIYGEQIDVNLASSLLFDGLRKLDEAGMDVILVSSFKEEGLGVAFMNRLNKAAGII